MKILHICKLGFEGAGNAASRHSEALKRKGIESKLLVLRGNADDVVVATNIGCKIRNFISKVFVHTIGHPQYVWHYMVGSYGLANNETVKNAEIVYIHWINDFIGYKDITWLLKHKKKVVWFLHDMWPMTGGCHHSLGCSGYTNKCADCPQLRFFKSLALIQQSRKIKKWSTMTNLIIASPSKWLADCAMKSSVFRGLKILVCPNVVDTDFFVPKDKSECRKRLGLDMNKRYIMLSAVAANNIYKGFDYLCNAITKVTTPDVEFLIVGHVNIDNYPVDVKSKIKMLGFISDMQVIVDVYNSADAYVTSSIAENFPNVVIEAMSCGTPCVGFATGGIPEQISHLNNGYLARYKDSNDLANGIDWVLNTEEYDKLCINARNYVVDNCSYFNVLKNHESILED